MNNLFAAIASQNSGLSAPSTTFPFMHWADTTNNLIKIRNAADSAWVTIASLVGDIWIPYRSGIALGDAAVQTVGTADLANLPNIEDIQNQQGIFLETTGSAGAYTLTLVPAISDYGEGQRFVAKANHDCPDNPTFNVNAKGAGNLVNPDGSQLSAGSIRDGQIFEVVRVGITFQVTSPLGVPTGDISMFFGSTAPNGWLLCDGGTIGNAASSGTARANADTELLFEFLWNNLGDAEAPVSSGRGASAQADFDANKTITIPDFQGRSPVGSGAGSGLTSRTLGAKGGEEDHALTEAENGPHDHILEAPNATGLPGSESQLDMPTSIGGVGGYRGLRGVDYTNGTGPFTAQTTADSGSGNGHNTMHPFTVVNFKIKL